MFLTVLMPCLNEERSISYCIQSAKLHLNKYDIDWEILIIDNNSIDNSTKFAIDLNVRVVVEKKQGYGAAIQRGIKEARGTYIILCDCDGSYDFSDLDSFIFNFLSGYDFVCGDRFKGKIDKGAMPILHRLGSPILSYIARKKFRLPISDFHCGLRGFKSDIAKAYNYTTYGMEFATELIYAFRNYKVTEVPVKLHKDLRNRKPHLRTFRDGFRHLNFILNNK